MSLRPPLLNSAKGRLPFFRYFFRDLKAFRRQGHPWSLVLSGAVDYWRADRKLDLEEKARQARLRKKAN